jgi:hypothetical protein
MHNIVSFQAENGPEVFRIYDLVCPDGIFVVFIGVSQYTAGQYADC